MITSFVVDVAVRISLTTDVVVTGVPFTVVVEPLLHVWIVVGVVTVVVVIGVVFLTTVVIGVVATVVMFLFTDRICSCLVGVRVVVATALVVPLVLVVVVVVTPRADDEETVSGPAVVLTTVGVGLPAAAPSAGVARVVNPALLGIVQDVTAIVVSAHGPAYTPSCTELLLLT